METTQVQRQLKFLNRFSIDWEKETEDHYVLDCIFCEAEQRMFINKYTFGWDCKKCGRQGGFKHFLTNYFFEILLRNTDKAGYIPLAQLRGLPLQAIEQSCCAIFEDQYYFPAYSGGNLISDYRHGKLGEKLKGIDGSEAGIYNVPDLLSARRELPVYVCEGEYDTIALKWLLNFLNKPGCVVGIPGVAIFKKEWIPLFQDRHIVIAYDHQEVAYQAVDRIANLLRTHVRSYSFIRWPDDFPTKFDINDFVSTYSVRGKDPIGSYDLLLSYVTEYRHKLIEKVSGKSDAVPIINVAPVKYTPTRTVSFKELIEEYNNVLDLNDNFIDCIKVCLATVLSSCIKGTDPLWMFLVGPPGYGKTAILTSLKECTDNCYFQSSIRKNMLVSGFRGKNDADPSLLLKVNGKCLVLKDYTEVMSKPQVERDEIFSILRGAFDGTVERDFGNDLSRRYDVNFSLLAGVTNVIKAFSQASLGERFLRFTIDTKQVDFYAQQTAALQTAIMGEEDKNTLKITVKEFLAKDWDFSQQTIKRLSTPEFFKKLVPLARLTAHLRTQVPRFEKGMSLHNVMYEPEPESGNRISIQLHRLAICLALLEERETIDQEVIRILKQVCMDSVAGYQLDITKQLVKLAIAGKRDITKSDLETVLGTSRTTITNVLLDMEVLKIVKQGLPRQSVKNALVKENTYNVTDYILNLWKESDLPV